MWAYLLSEHINTSGCQVVNKNLLKTLLNWEAGILHELFISISYKLFILVPGSIIS